MDNKLFNVNGRTKEQLALAVELLLLNEYNDVQKVRGWYYLEDKGLVLTWLAKDDGYKATPFTNRMGEPEDIQQDELVDLLWDWLNSDEASKVKFGDWEDDCDHDGSNEMGWRLYTEEWGHIKEGEHSIDHYSIGAFKPMHLWYGK